MAMVWIPSYFQNITGGTDRVAVPGKNVRQVIDNLEALYPGLKEVLLENGNINPGISVFVDGELGYMELVEPVKEESEVHFLPAISGG